MIRRYIVKFEQSDYSINNNNHNPLTWTISIEDLLTKENISLPKKLNILTASEAIDAMNLYCRELNNLEEENDAYLKEVKSYIE